MRRVADLCPLRTERHAILWLLMVLTLTWPTLANARQKQRPVLHGPKNVSVIAPDDFQSTLDAVRVLVAIMNDNDAPVRERRQAADAVLARAFGMPGEVHAAAVQMKPQVALEPITIPPRPELSPKALHQVARIILMDEMRQRHGDDAVVDDEDEDEGPPN